MSFTDPYDFQSAVRAGDVELAVTQRGDFHAELTRIDLHRLWMQRGRQSLSYVARVVIHKGRNPIFFLRDDHQSPIRHNGIELTPADIFVYGQGPEHHHRTAGECRWGSMSLRPEALAEAARALAGRDFTVPGTAKVIRPPPKVMSRLRHLHDAANHLALTAPDILAHPEVAKALEQELLRTMVACLTASTTLKAERLAAGRVLRRFEQVLERSGDYPLYLPEICAEVGVTARTLRQHCQDQLGMSPHRYLWLRRMHLARRALARADAHKTTVTEIATDHGFGELGRFAVTYRQLFGEMPSATLRRPPDDPSRAQHPPFG